MGGDLDNVSKQLWIEHCNASQFLRLRPSDSLLDRYLDLRKCYQRAQTSGVTSFKGIPKAYATI